MKALENPNIFYVYAHRRVDSGAIFYVGKGHGKRWRTPHGRSDLWRKVSAKHGFEPIILQDGLSEQEAFALEAKTIAFYRTVGVRLANLTNGGEGPSGRVFSSETRRKMAAAKLGRKMPREQADKIGKAHKGRKWTEEQRASLRGRVFSVEHRENLRKAATGRKMSAAAIEKMVASKRSARG